MLRAAHPDNICDNLARIPVYLPAAFPDY